LASFEAGQLLAKISAEIVAMLREYYGRGPMKAKTYALDDIIVVVMRGSGFTALRANESSRAASPSGWSRCARTSKP